MPVAVDWGGEGISFMFGHFSGQIKSAMELIILMKELNSVLSSVDNFFSCSKLAILGLRAK